MTHRRDKTSPARVGDLIKYRIYTGGGFTVVKVISLIETDTGTRAVIEVPYPYIYKIVGTYHVYPTQRYKNANLTPSRSGNVYKHTWFNVTHIRQIKPIFPKRKISEQPIDLKNGSIPPPKIELKLSEAIRIATEKTAGKAIESATEKTIPKPNPKNTKDKKKETFIVQNKDNEKSESESESESESKSESENESKSESENESKSESESEQEAKTTRATKKVYSEYQHINETHIPERISIASLPSPKVQGLEWIHPEHAVGMDTANRLKKLYISQQEWCEMKESSSISKCYDAKLCGFYRNSSFNSQNRGTKKETCVREAKQHDGVGLPFRFCVKDSNTRKHAYSSVIRNTAKFRICSSCTTQPKKCIAYNAKRYSSYCNLCLKTSANRILCAQCTRSVGQSNNESGAFLTDYIMDLIKVIPNLKIFNSKQTSCTYKGKQTRVDLLFDGSYDNTDFTLIIEYDENEHLKYDAKSEHEKMLIQLHFMIEANNKKKTFRLLFIRFNPVLDISHEGMKRIIILRQWIYWWISNLVDVKMY